MNGKYFIDTSIFASSFDDSNRLKQGIAKRLIRKAIENNEGCISYQVVREFLNIATKKFVVPLTVSDCEDYLNEVLSPLCQVYVDIDLYIRSLDIMERWKYSFYDSLILAASLHADCTILYTEDMQHQQKIQGLTIINPFKQ